MKARLQFLVDDTEDQLKELRLQFPYDPKAPGELAYEFEQERARWHEDERALDALYEEEARARVARDRYLRSFPPGTLFWEERAPHSIYEPNVRKSWAYAYVEYDDEYGGPYTSTRAIVNMRYFDWEVLIYPEGAAYPEQAVYPLLSTGLDQLQEFADSVIAFLSN